MRAKKRFSFATRTGSEIAVNEKTVRQCIMTRVNFEVKRGILLRNWGACVDTRFWHVSRKCVAKEKRFCVVRSMDLEMWSRIAVENLVDRGREIN